MCVYLKKLKVHILNFFGSPSLNPQRKRSQRRGEIEENWKHLLITPKKNKDKNKEIRLGSETTDK